MNTESVVILTPASETDRYGNTVADWEDVTYTTVDGCLVAPGGSSEVNDGRTATTEAPIVYFPSAPAVTALCRVRVRDETFDVDGVPDRWETPRGPRLVVKLRKVAG